MPEISQMRLCKRCGAEKPLNDLFWYKQRPRVGHPKGSWQSNCKVCWQDVNRANKARRKSLNLSNVASGSAKLASPTSATTK